MNNKKGVKLLAAIMVLAIAVAGFAVMNTADVDAAPVTSNCVIDVTDSTTMANVTGAEYTSGTHTLKLDGYNGTKGFYYPGSDKLTIIVSGTNTIQVDRGENNVKSSDVAAVYVKDAAVDIKPDTENGTEADILNVKVTGAYASSDGSEHTYGIYAKGIISVSDVELNMEIAKDDRFAFAITTEATGLAINFTNTTGTIVGGNRAIQSTGKTTTFTDSTMTLKGGEKAIQAKDSNGAVVLRGSDGSHGSNITLELIDCPGSNTGVDDRFGLKVTTLTVGATSTLNTQGLHYTNTTALAAAWSGKVIVSGGYDQNCPKVMNTAGLYLDKPTVIQAFNGTKTTAKVGKITITDDADVFNISVNGESTVAAVTTAADQSALKANVAQAIPEATATQSNVWINLSGITGSGALTLQIDNLKGNDVTLVLPAVTVIKDVQVKMKANESVSFVAMGTGATYTFTHVASDGTEIASASITGTTGHIYATPGSVNFEILGAGTLELNGDGKLTGTITGNTMIQTETGKPPANVDLSGVTITTGTLTLSGINVKSSDYIVNGGTIAFTGNTTIDGSIFVNGGNISGTIDNGNLVVKGDVTVSAATTINDDAKLNVSKGSVVTIADNTTLTNAGTINLSGIIDNDNDEVASVYSKVMNNGKIVILDKDASIASLDSRYYGGTGVIDSSSIASDVQMVGDIETVTTYGLYQTVTITGNVTLLKGSQIIINGALVINEGVTVTIEDGAQLVITGPAATMENNGTIVVESDVLYTEKNKNGSDFGSTTNNTNDRNGGLVLSNNSISTNNGVITLAYALLPTDGSGNKVSMTVSAKLINNGTISVGEDNKMNNTVAVENKADGTITVNGEIVNVNNAGSVVIDGKAGTINNIADGATVSVISTKADLSINDTNFVYGKTPVTGTNSISITIRNATSVGTFTVVSEVTKKTNNDGTVTYGKKFIVAGAISETIASGETSHAAVALAGTVDVADELTISDNINVTGGTLSVSGKVTAKEGRQIGVDTLTVTGEVIVGASTVSASTTVNAAMYKVVVINPASTTYYYTTLDKAIAGATEASVNEVTATGDVVVKANIEVPAGMTVKQTSGKITVGSSTATDVTMTVAQGGKINQTTGATIDVKGTLYIVDKKTGINKGATVTCEVVSEGTTDLRYTNLNAAIAAAGSDEVTITLNGETVIKSDSVIPENVTIDMNGNKFAVEGAKLTINGTLYVDVVTNYTVSDVTGTVTKEGKVIVNGYIVSEDPIAYNKDTAKSPAGVYYIADSLNIITSIENIDEAVSEADDNVVAVNGENVAKDLTITGTSDEPVMVNVNGKLTAGKITLDFATIVLKQNIEVTATIANANGSVALTDVKAVNDTKFVANENTDKVKVLTVDSGSITNATDRAKTYAVVMDGDVTVKAIILADIADRYSLTVDGNVKVIGSNNSLENVLVNGTLTADNAVTVNATNIDVIGSLVAEKATETKIAGTVAVTKTLVVGSTYKAMTTGAAASATGSISYTTLFVLDGATVDESIIADMKSTTFYVEGAVWMVGYTSDVSSAVDINAINIIPIKDAFFNGTWRTDLTSDDYDVENGVKVGQRSAVYALITYDIYDVKVVADNGIGTISIDGVVLVKGANIDNSGENVFTLPFGMLKAGAHQITYTVKDGYDGSVKILVDGTAISGNTFTLSGTEGISAQGVVSVSINVSGTEPTLPTPVQPSEKDSGMGITDYLLIVLVVLAAILVVVVAIRMMRS